MPEAGGQFATKRMRMQAERPKRGGGSASELRRVSPGRSRRAIETFSIIHFSVGRWVGRVQLVARRYGERSARRRIHHD